ncbi:hypothetical protein GCM10011496_28940 [Polaromonas eurypsychrophila]|uniref:Uncharacterized protein n=1 Tax=Polaromonas eurypsychrophila TaxID=1614635 RepID=A0A916SLM1_9BURK|nr:hypothetical protein GCM10011496_28940 [Polaromonas eurypsychrophila]
MNLSVIADLIRNPCRAGLTGLAGRAVWMPDQVRHDKAGGEATTNSVIADLIRNPCRAGCFYPDKPS